MSKIPKYLIPDSPKRKSLKQEKRIAQKGFVMPASGAFWPYKGDVLVGNYLIEAKRTDAQSMSVKEEWLEKIFKEASIQGKEPGMELEFENYCLQGVVIKK